MEKRVPQGRKSHGRISFVPPGLVGFLSTNPVLKHWAIFGRPKGTTKSIEGSEFRVACKGGFEDLQD